jgi:hypothetical protein
MTLGSPSHPAGAGAATAASAAAPKDIPAQPCGRTLPEICHTLQRKVNAFLDEQTDDAVLHGVQSQARVSIDVIKEALQRYGWVPRSPPGSAWQLRTEEALAVGRVYGLRRVSHVNDHQAKFSQPSI